MSDGGWVPRPTRTLLVAFWWPRLPSLLFLSAYWDFFGGVAGAGALLEAVWVIFRCGWQQRGWRCCDLRPFPILGLIPVPCGVKQRVPLPRGTQRGGIRIAEPLSAGCGSLLVSRIAGALINPRPGEFFLPVSVGRLEPIEMWSFCSVLPPLTTLMASRWRGTGPLGSPPSPIPVPGHSLRVPTGDGAGGRR